MSPILRTDLSRVSCRPLCIKNRHKSNDFIKRSIDKMFVPPPFVAHQFKPPLPCKYKDESWLSLEYWTETFISNTNVNSSQHTRLRHILRPFLQSNLNISNRLYYAKAFFGQSGHVLYCPSAKWSNVSKQSKHSVH